MRVQLPEATSTYPCPFHGHTRTYCRIALTHSILVADSDKHHKLLVLFWPTLDELR